MEFKVSNRILKEIESHYANGQPKLQIATDGFGKPQLLCFNEKKKSSVERNR